MMDELERSTSKAKSGSHRQDGVRRKDIQRVDAAALHQRARELRPRDTLTADPHGRAARLRTELPQT
jgi:hypothetical protein